MKIYRRCCMDLNDHQQLRINHSFDFLPQICGRWSWTLAWDSVKNCMTDNATFFLPDSGLVFLQGKPPIRLSHQCTRPSWSSPSGSIFNSIMSVLWCPHITPTWGKSGPKGTDWLKGASHTRRLHVKLCPNVRFVLHCAHKPWIGENTHDTMHDYSLCFVIH